MRTETVNVTSYFGYCCEKTPVRKHSLSLDVPWRRYTYLIADLEDQSMELLLSLGYTEIDPPEMRKIMFNIKGKASENFQIYLSLMLKQHEHF